MGKLIYEQFESLAKMCGALNTRPTCKDAGNASHEGEDTGHGKDWSGTDTYEEADILMKYGDKESLSLINTATKRIKAKANNTEERVQAKVRRSVVGSRPCVPHAINGHPLSMYRRTTVHVSKPVINVYYSRSAMCNVEAEDMALAGAKVIEAIKIVERSGVRINLYVGAVLESSRESVVIFARAKDSDKDVDFARMAYPFVNPAFFRRHVFRYIETKRELTQDAWNCGYGHRAGNEKILFEAGNKDKSSVFLSYYQIKSMSSEQIAELITK